MKILAPLLLIGLAACADDSRDYPALLPTADILAEPTLPDHASVAASSGAAVEQDLDDRAAGLRRTADALRAPVIEDEFLAQMKDAQSQRPD